MSKHDRTGRLSTWVAVVVLVCLVAVIFFPIVGFEFVNFDVGTSVVENPYVRGFTAGHTAAAALLPALIVVLLLGLRSTGQVETWRDRIGMWENCVRVTPNDGFLHDALARTLASRGYREKALWHAKRSMELDYIDNHASLCNRAMGLALTPNMTIEDRAEAVRLAERACDLTGWKDPKCLETLPVVYSSLAAAQVAAGQYAAALENYRKAIERDEDNENVLLNIALLLATCDCETRRRRSGWPSGLWRRSSGRRRTRCGS